MLVSWVMYEGAQFSENMYVLEKGEYSTTEAMGLASTAALRSVQHIGHVSTGAVLQGDSHVTVSSSLSSSCPGAFPALHRPVQQGPLQRS